MPRRPALLLRPSTSALRALKSWSGSLIDLLYPPVCAICHARLDPNDDTVCDLCASELSLRPDWRCPRCGGAGLGEGPRPGRRCRLCPPDGMAYAGVLSVTGYHDHAARAVQLFKYQRRLELGELMSRLMVYHLAEPIADLKNRIDYVTPVPLHWRRRIERGFNQSDLLGRALAQNFALRYNAKLMRRTRHTKRQALVPREHRATNVEGAFALRGGIHVRGAGILLIDDVVTSGHTIHECAKVLTEHGAREVWVASFARAGMSRTGDEE